MGPMSRRTNLTEDEKSKMKELDAVPGKKRFEIAKEMNCHPSVVSRVLGRRNLQSKPESGNQE